MSYEIENATPCLPKNHDVAFKIVHVDVFTHALKLAITPL